MKLVCCVPERSRLPSRAGASGSHHPSWTLPRVLQIIPEGHADRYLVIDGLRVAALEQLGRDTVEALV
jgi:hypothetical protein